MKTAVIAVTVCLLALGFAAPVADAEDPPPPTCRLVLEERMVRAGPFGVIYPAPNFDCRP